ncbi:TIGR03915 family putative DNA repair protein [Pseudomonas sp. 5P_3.1_Bac2]|uniref:TIGR03915 family putative DNA repair protein n=1 Tax=Pseudomonas sp. 5P_3.1_Bac2 TaxID=2971617 RepID=UPI0021C59F5B|nr:TIGR03915 family putative DNA repair protein [Pseudomonas sp. 5P_3.1_Bac2]MCU1718645.1 TIGR03915 family putative DNA repair protein [Pseudomonas sp. 5P_3.1_Bac2]
MHNLHFDGSFEAWRDLARSLLMQGVAPAQISWHSATEQHGQSGSLFSQFDPQPSSRPADGRGPRVPRKLLEMLEQAACYRCIDRWSLLYRILWRVAQGEHSAMLAGDHDGSSLHQRLKAVRREAHHLHAFLRFQPCPESALHELDIAPQWLAWHEPAHDILLSASEHFSQRLGRSRWLIATPDDGVYWDGQQLHYQRPCPAQWQALARAPQLSEQDSGQALWLSYYASTFNPARLNPSVMQNHMPVRFWKNLPEGPLIGQLMSQARAGAQRDGQAAAVAAQPGKRIRQQPSTKAD